jgi:glycerophosphoryl diester phosphodiesterase
MPMINAIAVRFFLLVAIAVPLMAPVGIAQTSRRPLLIAHRGASGYAPEHTLAAYRLAIEQGADFVEQDLQVTKDGVLICLHDPDLARTTDVAEIYPDRAVERDVEGTGRPRRGWYTIDFTLQEIKRLDAGSWFNKRNPLAARSSYVGLRIPTMEEAISTVGDRAGLYIELKHFEFYRSRGFDTAGKLAALLRTHGFDNPAERDRIFVQSFWKSGLLRMREVAPSFRRIQLLPMEDPGRGKDSSVVTPVLAREIAAFAVGVGPSKTMLKSKADVDALHSAGLLIHPYTFRGSVTAVIRRPLDQAGADGTTLRAEIIADIRRYIAMGIDGGFTDYPAVWKTAVK